MALFEKPTARQKEIRRTKAERQPPWYRRLAERLNLRPLAIVVGCALAAGVIVNLGGDTLKLRVGQRVPRAITSRVAFMIEDLDRTEMMRTWARDNAEIYYALDTDLLQDVNNRLTNALRIAREQAADPAKVREQIAEISISLDEAALAEIVGIASQPDSTLYERAVERAIQNLRREPLVEAKDLASRRTGANAVLLDPEQSTERPISILKLLFSNDPAAVEQVAERTAAEFPEPLRQSVAASLVVILQGPEAGSFKPLYRYDTARSAQAAQQAEQNVPTQHVDYAVGAQLADAGQITPDELELLREEHGQYHQWRRGDQETYHRHLWTELARALLCFVIVVALGGYIVLHYDKALGTTRRRLATALTLLLVLLLARAAYLHTPVTHLVIGAQAFAVMLLAITAVRGIANVISALLAVLIALATHQGVGLVLGLIVVSLVLLTGLRDIRSRGRIISIGFLAALVAGFTTLLTCLLDGQTLGFVLRTQAPWAAGITLAAAFLIEGLLPTIEKLFGVTTSMTLLEWCDPNKPLLRMLAADAPGTYNHSLLVSTLADAAAEAIDANGLLARTGAYYHDIGKINKPGYFVENQVLEVGNRHERLSPAMSHLIIIGHVKDGIEMAKEYKLPARLRPFIPEHHGTCVVEYFYHAASQARKPGDPEVSDAQFRYPGPKPQSRETAIVMLCDAVEGAVRAMPEPTPNRIEDTVSRIIEKRMVDDQFDACDLTFRELAVIRDSVVKSLNSVYHGRITYPSDEKPTEPRNAS